MVGDDDIDAQLHRPVYLKIVGDAAVHGDDEGAVVGGEFLHRLHGKAVGVLSAGNAPAHINAQLLEAAVEDGGAGDAVHVPVAENQHLLPLVPGCENAVHRILHTGKQEGTVEETEVVLQIIQNIAAAGDVPAGKDGGG